MKKILAPVVIAFMLTACNTNTDTTRKTDTTSNAAYAPSEGDVTKRNGQVMVWQDGEWKPAGNDVHLNNGIVVNRRGEVIKEDKVIVLDDGEVVDKSGRFFDKAGNAIDDAWDATKKGVKKVGEEVKDVFNDNDNDSKKDKKKDKDK
jgi:hypothetical protein